MIQVSLPDGQAYDVEFLHHRQTYVMTPEGVAPRAVTVAYSNGEGTPTGYINGVMTVNPHRGTPSKATRRKEAYAKMLQAGGFNREYRTIFWDAYFAKFPEKGNRVWHTRHTK